MSTARRTGRPRKRAGATPTRDRLVDAAIAVFVEQGFGQASVTEIAERAGISGPAVYKHFDGKADLLIEAARRSLDSSFAADLSPAPRTPVDIALQWLSDDFAPTRRLLVDLHLSAGRNVELAALLAEWHLERARAWQHEHGGPTDHVTSLAQIEAYYLLLLGLAQVDSLAALDADRTELRLHVARMVDAVFTEPTDARPIDS